MRCAVLLPISVILGTKNAETLRLPRIEQGLITEAGYQGAGAELHQHGERGRRCSWRTTKGPGQGWLAPGWAKS